MKKIKLSYGVAINDADYPVHHTVNGKQFKCPYYRSWQNMINRCYSKRTQSKRPTYIGCSTTPEWLGFMSYRSWMVDQDWQGNHLDKDLLFPGNKIYGPNTCVFIPKELNLFTTDRVLDRGEWPLGVCKPKWSQKFTAQCSNPITGKREHIGYFDDPETAHLAWLKRKNEIANILADQQTDPRIAKALRDRYSRKITGVSP